MDNKFINEIKRTLLHAKDSALMGDHWAEKYYELASKLIEDYERTLAINIAKEDAERWFDIWKLERGFTNPPLMILSDDSEPKFYPRHEYDDFLESLGDSDEQ